MDFHVGIAGKDFAMLCCDTRAVQQIITIKDDEEKLIDIDDRKMFAISGEAGDRVHFCEYVVANVKLYAFRNGRELSTKAVANYTRTELNQALRQVLTCGQAIASACSLGLSPCGFTMHLCSRTASV
jgi:20S proteasome subunit beta 4